MTRDVEPAPPARGARARSRRRRCCRRRRARPRLRASGQCRRRLASAASPARFISVVARDAAGLDRVPVHRAHLARPNRCRRAAIPCARLYWPSAAGRSSWPAKLTAERTRSGCARASTRMRARTRLRPGRRRRHRSCRGRGAISSAGSRERRHGGMDYMARHGSRRSRPGGTGAGHAARHLRAHGDLPRPMRGAAAGGARRRPQGYVARYALGRDYHKVLRGRLADARGAARGASSARSATARSSIRRR